MIIKMTTTVVIPDICPAFKADDVVKTEKISTVNNNFLQDSIPWLTFINQSHSELRGSTTKSTLYPKYAKTVMFWYISTDDTSIGGSGT